MVNRFTRSSQSGLTLWAALIWIPVSVIVAIGLVWLNSLSSGIRQRVPPVVVTSAINADSVVSGVTQEAVGRHLDALKGFPTRMAGTPGSDHAAQYIRRTFEDLGLRVFEHPIAVTVPVTRYCQLLDEDGKEIPNVRLHPFWPNVVRPCTIPAPGVQGEAILIEHGSAFFYRFAGHDPTQTIPLVRMSSDEQWIGLADAGFPAVVFFDDDSVRPTDYFTKELNFPANFPRFYLVGDPKTLDGKKVRIRCRVDWQTCYVPQIIAVLEPKEPPAVREAIVLTSHYDSIGWVPDVAPGAESASPVAVMLAAADFAVRQRDHLKRSMVFIALAGHGQACSGARWLADLWGPPGEETQRTARIEQQINRRSQRLALLEQEVQLSSNQAYWSIVGETESAEQRERHFWQARPVELAAVVLEDFRRVIEQEVEQAQEALIQCDLRRKRRRDEADATLEKAFEDAREKVEKLRVAATATLLELKTHHGLTSGGRRIKAFNDRLSDKRQRLQQQIVRDEQAQLAQQVLQSFDSHFIFCLSMTSGSPVTGILAHYPETAMRHGAANWFAQIAAQIVNHTRPLMPTLAGIDPNDPSGQAKARDLFRDLLNQFGQGYAQGELNGGSMEYPFNYYYEYVAFLAEGRHAVTWVTPLDEARQIGTPQDTFDRIDVANLTVAARTVAAVSSRMAAGQVQLNPAPHIARTKQANGWVLQAADANSLIPTRGVPNALIVARHHRRFTIGAVRQEDVVMTDDDGRFIFPPADSIKPPEDFQAFRIDPPTGDIIAVKDMGEKGEASFPTARKWNNFDNPLRLVLFRCGQTDLFYPLHPSMGTELGSAFAVERRTLASPQSFAVLSGNQMRPYWSTIRAYGQGFSLFNPPAEQIYIGLRSASPLDASMTAVVAYLLGDGRLAAEPPPGREIWGPGYIAADTKSIRMWPHHAAEAMAAINGYRLARQERHRVADPILVDQQRTAAAAKDRAREQFEIGAYPDALHHSLDSMAIAMEVYPRIGQTERDAVVAVIFYLFLLIPFSIFVERLLFGFADIRAQMAAVVAIFAVIFLLLRWLHPAFELVRSGVMVLVGFLTLALSLFVTLYLFTRFQTNIKQLRLHLQRTAEAADVSRIAAAGTAFLLGINNMRKRPVRTAFTCTTLVLLTFALLSLTAVSRPSRFKQIAVGMAPYTGLLIKGPNNGALPGTASLMERFGQDYPVSRVFWYEFPYRSPRGSVRAMREHPSGEWTGDFPVARMTKIVGFDPEEPNITPVTDALMYGRWFRTDSERACILPLHAAQRLSITREDVEAERVKVWIQIQRMHLTVIGVFDPAKLDAIRDLDGESFLPYDGDIAAAGDPDQITMPQRIPRLPAEEVMLMASRVVPGASPYRLAVNMNHVEPDQAMAAINEFLQRWTDFVNYGIGGVAYWGRIYRGTQIKGLAEILVPLLIASAIVLNTMLGSVYERADEIGVYSAVGLSPTHVHYLFLAEACVYATIGAVAGYLLAHGLGAILGALGLTSGLAFNYSTLSTLYATLAMIAAVLLSTLYPARKAARLAMPSENTTIQVPQPDGDVMEIALPFTYVELDAISVVPFLYDVLEDHGEGSSADFFCQTPQLIGAMHGSTRPDAGEDASHDNAASYDREAVANGRSFGVHTRCWLKPYDLGISQIMTLTIDASAFAGVWYGHLHLQRVSGDVSSWRRANKLFLTVLRKHLLAWRGLEDVQRDDYLVRGLAGLNLPVDRYLPSAEQVNK